MLSISRWYKFRAWLGVKFEESTNQSLPLCLPTGPGRLTFTWWGCYGLCFRHRHGLSIIFHSINSPNNSPLSYPVLPVLYLPYWSFQLYLSLWKSPLIPDVIFLWVTGLKTPTSSILPTGFTSAVACCISGLSLCPSVLFRLSFTLVFPLFLPGYLFSLFLLTAPACLSFCRSLFLSACVSEFLCRSFSLPVFLFFFFSVSFSLSLCFCPFVSLLLFVYMFFLRLYACISLCLCFSSLYLSVFLCRFFLLSAFLCLSFSLSLFLSLLLYVRLSLSILACLSLSLLLFACFSMSLLLCARLSLLLSACLSVSLSLFFSLPVSLFLLFYACQFVSVFLRLSFSLPLSLSFYVSPPVCTSLCRCPSLSLFLSLSVSVCLSLSKAYSLGTVISMSSL